MARSNKATTVSRYATIELAEALMPPCDKGDEDTLVCLGAASSVGGAGKRAALRGHYSGPKAHIVAAITYFVQTRHLSKRHIAEDNHSRGKALLEIDLNNSPDEVLENSIFFHGPSDTATSAHLQSVIPVEDCHEPANTPVYADDIEDEVVFLSESNQVNRNERELNWNGRTSGGNRSIDIIHIDS